MKVYAVYKNLDMTEGRGPMVLDKIFLNREDAWEFANKQPGIMGRSGYRDHGMLSRYNSNYGNGDTACTGWSCTLCYPYGGDWEVRQLEVHDDLQSALSKFRNIDEKER